MTDIERVESITDPAERAVEIGKRLAEIPAYQERLRVMRQAAVLELRDAGHSLADIGVKLNLHRNRVGQILQGRAGGGKGSHAKAADMERLDG